MMIYLFSKFLLVYATASLGWVDESLGAPSIHHSSCQWLLDPQSKVARCSYCASLRDTLRNQSKQLSDRDSGAILVTQTSGMKIAMHNNSYTVNCCSCRYKYSLS